MAKFQKLLAKFPINLFQSDDKRLDQFEISFCSELLPAKQFFGVAQQNVSASDGKTIFLQYFPAQKITETEIFANGQLVKVG